MVILVLVIVHELGHFLAAKISKMRVEEFAFGFPPKLFSKKMGETTYAFNLLPIGGYVKITGESFDEEEREKLKTDKRAFQNRPKLLQIFVLVAGVTMNMILAAIIFTFLNTKTHLMPVGQEYDKYIQNPKTYIIDVAPNSPASLAGIENGSEVISVKSGNDSASIDNVESVIDLVKKHYDEYILISYKDKSGNIKEASVLPTYNEDKTKKTIGIALQRGEYVKLEGMDIIKFGIQDTYNYTKLTVAGLKDTLVKLVKGENVSDSVAGPVGIAKMVGKASESGVDNILFLTAILSISLAVLNILPIPALDGGRIMFVLIEMVTRRNISHKIQYFANAFGFIFLMSLMLITVYLDIFR